MTEKRKRQPKARCTGIKRIPGTNPDMPLRRCPTCCYELPLAYYGAGTKPGGPCIVCRDAALLAKPWEPREIAALLTAVSRVLDLWPKYADRWEEDDLQRLRDLVAASGREPGVPLAVLSGARAGGQASPPDQAA